MDSMEVNERNKKDMKRISTLSIILLLAIMTISPVVTPFANSREVNNVVTDFVSGIGIRIVVENNNDYPIFNVSLNTFEVSGFFIGGGYDTSACIGEIRPENSDYFTTLIFGIGHCSAHANMSYEDHGEKIYRDIQGDLFLIGLFTLVIAH
jgi:hypothetical protein